MKKKLQKGFGLFFFSKTYFRTCILSYFEVLFFFQFYGLAFLVRDTNCALTQTDDMPNDAFLFMNRC